jgi:hypothetical protein
MDYHFRMPSPAHEPHHNLKRLHILMVGNADFLRRRVISGQRRGGSLDFQTFPNMWPKIQQSTFNLSSNLLRHGYPPPRTGRAALVDATVLMQIGFAWLGFYGPRARKVYIK